MDCLRNTGRWEQGGPKRKAMETVTTRSSKGTEPPKLIGVYNLPQIAGDGAGGTTVFNVCPVGFCTLVPSLCISLYVSFEIEMFILCH